MKTKLKYFIPILLLSACTGNKESDEMTGPLFPQPQTIEANPKNGYTLNQTTGDTIQTLVNSFGDTIISGVPIPAYGKTIHPDSVSKPLVVKVATELVEVNAHPNVHYIPENLTKIPANQDSLTTALLIAATKNDGLHYLVNKTGDTIKTGIPIPIKGKTVPTSYPQFTPELSPRFKDAAINNIQYLDVDQGMASSYVKSILEDKSGNLWFGTEGGVSRYDGKSFIHFTQKEGLSSNNVLSILEDKSGNLWFGTYGGGVSRYDGESFTHFTEKEGLSNNFVWSILEDKSGHIWFGTDGGGVCRYDSDELGTGGTFTHFTKNEGLTSNYVWSILEDKSGNLWFGTWGGGVNRYDGNSVDDVVNGTNLYNHGQQDLEKIKKNPVKSFTHFTENEGLSSNVWSIIEDKSGNLWFGTHQKGVTRYDGNCVDDIVNGTNLYEHNQQDLEKTKKNPVKSFMRFTEKEGLSNNSVLSIIEDKGGNIWFGTRGGGVSCYSPDKLGTGGTFTHFTVKEGLSNNVVFSIAEDTRGNLWIGTEGGGVSRYDVKSFTHFSEKEGLNSNVVVSIIEDKGGNLWFAALAGGVSKYDGKLFEHFTKKEGLIDNHIYSMLEDKSGNLWFGTNSGVVCFNGNCVDDIVNGTNLYEHNQQEIEKIKKNPVKTSTLFTVKEGLSHNVVRAIIEDKSGNLWFGTNEGGVSRYEPDELGTGGTFTHFTEKEGLSNNSVRSIIEDKSGNLWFGTYGGGVTRYDGNCVDDIVNGTNLYEHNQQDLEKIKKNPAKSFTHFTEKEGLSNNVVVSIIEDKGGNLWFGTRGGVSCYTPDELGTSGTFIHYTEKEGLSNNVIRSIVEDRSGDIWLGTDNGINLLKHENISNFNGKNKTLLIQVFEKNDGLKGMDLPEQCVFRQ